MTAMLTIPASSKNVPARAPQTHKGTSWVGFGLLRRLRFFLRGLGWSSVGKSWVIHSGSGAGRRFSSSRGRGSGGVKVMSVLASAMIEPQPGQRAFAAVTPSGIRSLLPHDLQAARVGTVASPQGEEGISRLCYF